MNLLNLRRRTEVTEHDERHEPRQLPPRSLPTEHREFSPPPLRRDPELDAMTMSANTLLALRNDKQQLEIEVAHLRAERETWRARAVAKQELLDETMREMLRYKSFCDAFTARFGDVSVLLVKLIEDANSAARSFASSDSVQQGSQTEPLLNESHLTPDTENQNDSGK